ncbi:MAG: Holliday junction resolvase-like protein, partial [Acidobacteriaceae bacterium]
GRIHALSAVKKLDPVFGPRKLNPQDAKVLFHPVDYVIFKGMKPGPTERILFLDRNGLSKDRLALQRSIGRAVDKGNYEWLTIRVNADGKITEE